MPWFAHPRHDLEQHLRDVASAASRFASDFQSGDWAYLAGLWHDLGKYQEAFQARLRGSLERVEHSGAGAAFACQADKMRCLPIAFAIAGHHAGLANLVKSENGTPTPLERRLLQNQLLPGKLRSVIPASLLETKLPAWPRFIASPGKRDVSGRRLEFWTRMLFSALVDRKSTRLNSSHLGISYA